MNKNTISKWFSMFLLMMVAGITGATAQSLTVADFTLEQGKMTEVKIQMAAPEDQPIYGIQTDITLSEGLILEEVAAVREMDFYQNQLTNGATRVALLSLAGASIAPGDVIKLHVKAADNFVGGTISLTNSKLTTSTAGAESPVADATATVKMTPATALIKPTTSITEEFTSIAALEGKTFAIVNKTDGKALYGSNNQNLAYDVYANAFSSSNSGYMWKLVSLANDADTTVHNYYRFQLVTPSGADYNCWGMGGWLNSQPATGACSFILGLNNQNGQDIKNGAVYDVQYVEGQGFTLKNIATGLYQGANNGPAKNEAPSYFTFASVGSTYVPAVEALLAEGAAWKTLVTDEAALTAYNTAVANIDPTAITGDGLTEAKAVDAAIVELSKAQPATPGTIFTRAIVNPSFEIGNGDGWTNKDGGWIQNTNAFGARTGSFFFEKWTDAANKLSNGSFLQTIKGLPNGKYKLTAQMQNREQGNSDAAGTGFFLVANEGKAEAVTNEGKTFEVIGTTKRGGRLEIGTKLENCSGNWICFDNFQLTFVEAVAAPVEVTDTFNFAAADFREKVGTAMNDVNGNIYNETFTAGGATLQVTAGSAASKLYKDNNRGQNLVTYKEYTTLTFKAPEGKAIVQIDFTAAGNSNINNFTASSGVIEGMSWIGEAEGVRFAQGGTSYLANAIVTMIDKTASTEALPAIEYTECANIAAFNALAAGTYAKVTLTDAEVIGKSADGYSTVWMQDATGGCWIQYTSLNDKLNEKTKINGTVYAVARPNSGNMQMKEAEATLQSALEATAIEAYTMIEDSLAKVNVAANLNKVVKIVADSLVMTSATAGKLYADGTSIDVTNGNATANQQLCKIAGWEKGKKLENITVEAILVAKSATVNQLLPISITEAAGPAEGLAQTLNVERYPGQGYTAQQATVDFTEAKAYLGVEEITTDMLRIVNPDGTQISDYAPFDGWFNAEGAAEAWGGNSMINVKFFQAIPEGTYTICDMNGADEVGKTYTVKWALVANDKQVTYTINVKFVDKPIVALKLGDLTKKDEVIIPFTSDVEKCYEGLQSNVDIAAILAKLEVEKLADLDIYAVMPDSTLDTNYWLGSTDGWRDSTGNWTAWGENARFCVKVDFAAEANQIAFVGGMDGQNLVPVSYAANFAFVKKNDTHDAVLLKVTLTYTDDLKKAKAALQAIIAADKTIQTEGQQGADAFATAIATAEGAANAADATVESIAAARAALAAAVATFTKANIGADFAEIPQDQGKDINDGATRASVVEGEGYTQYTTDGSVCVIIKKYDIDVKDCDYVTIKFAEPLPNGINAAFWAQSGTDNVGMPAGTYEYKYVFADDNKCAIANDVLPQLTLLTLWNSQTVNIVGVYKHYTEDYMTRINTLKTQRENGAIFNLNGQKVNKAQKGLYIINGKRVVVK